MSLGAMRTEIQNQVEDLPRFAHWLRKQPLPKVNQFNTVFTGSGDSYATALFARGLSNGVVGAWDPGELSLQPERARNKYVFLVSASGRTRASVDLSRKLKRFSRKRIAITANHASPLAEVCDGSLLLQFRSSGVLTSGTVSFTTSLLAVAHLLGKLPSKLTLEPAIRRSASRAKTIEVPRNGGFNFLGSSVNRALAEYGACKVREVLGAKASAMFPEQFGHAQLFSVDRRKDVVIGISGDPKDPSSRVSRFLRENGFRTYSMTGQSRDIVVRSLETSFYLQDLVLSLAAKRGLRECRFLTNQSSLQLSNMLIY